MIHKYTFHVTGTHCASCKILIEDILKEEELVKNVQVNLKRETVEIQTENDQSTEELAEILTSKTKPNGYTLSVEKINISNKKDDVIWKAIPIGLAFLILFFILQKSGILNLGLGSKTTPVTSFIIGLLASVSSCLAIVGGLVLSLSAKISQDEVNDTKTFLLFHLGRLISFAILGGVLGLIGSAIGISFTFEAILGFVASLVMLLLGLNLVGLFAKNKVALPSGIFQKSSSVFRRIEHQTFTPLVIGFGTFFLPCGVRRIFGNLYFGGLGLALLLVLKFLLEFFLLFYFSLSLQNPVQTLYQNPTRWLFCRRWRQFHLLKHPTRPSKPSAYLGHPR